MASSHESTSQTTETEENTTPTKTIATPTPTSIPATSTTTPETTLTTEGFTTQEPPTTQVTNEDGYNVIVIAASATAAFVILLIIIIIVIIVTRRRKNEGKPTLLETIRECCRKCTCCSDSSSEGEKTTEETPSVRPQTLIYSDPDENPSEPSSPTYTTPNHSAYIDSQYINTSTITKRDHIPDDPGAGIIYEDADEPAGKLPQNDSSSSLSRPVDASGHSSHKYVSYSYKPEIHSYKKIHHNENQNGNSYDAVLIHEDGIKITEQDQVSAEVHPEGGGVDGKYVKMDNVRRGINGNPTQQQRQPNSPQLRQPKVRIQVQQNPPQIDDNLYVAQNAPEYVNQNQDDKDHRYINQGTRPQISTNSDNYEVFDVSERNPMPE